MPTQITDPLFGHRAVFYSSKAHHSAKSDITWGPNSIEVPSSSPLNGIADVWFRLKSVPTQRIRQWCRNTNVTYLGLWHCSEKDGECPIGFGFRVPHFSRFRFDESDDSDENGADDDQPSTPAQQARVQRAGSTPARPRVRQSSDARKNYDEQVVVGNARVDRAGSTPARPRARVVRTGRSDAANEREARPSSLSVRPRMSTRSIVDLDDTDPDMYDDDEDSSSMLPDYDISQRALEQAQPAALYDPFNPLHQQQADAQAKLRADSITAPRSHRQLTFDNGSQPGHYQGFEPVQQWPTALGADAPTVHRLRDALFTQSRRESIKYEPMTDIDMADKAIIKADDQFVDGGTSDHADLKSGNAGDDAFLLAARQAEEEADFPDGESQPRIQQAEEAEYLGDTIVSSIPTFPPLSESCAADKEKLWPDLGLSLGRSTRMCFTPASQYISSVYLSKIGFTANIFDIHVLIPNRRMFSRILSAHCLTWFGCARRKPESDEFGANVDGVFTSQFEAQRGVRMPTLSTAFADGLVADQVLERMSSVLQTLHDVCGDANAQHASVAFGALLALYKSTDSDVQGDGQPELLHRLAQWSAGRAGSAFDVEDVEDVRGLRKAVIALSRGDVDKAVEVAMEQGHFRLAMLISRALEVPKTELRKDADAQLDMYGLIMESTPSNTQGDGDKVLMSNLTQENPFGLSSRSMTDNEISPQYSPISEENPRPKTPWHRMLAYCEEEANVSINERMILLILAGRVAPVAHYLKLSWYRLFTMELLYGAGSSGEDESILQWQRVAAAVNAVEDAKISTFAPHGETRDLDVIYQLLRLYAEESDKHKHSLTMQIYNNSGFGVTYRPMDYRFSWILHQALSALIPEASPRMASAKLADGLAAQLKEHGLFLWAFYVLCSANMGPEVLKETLIRDWPSMCNDVVELNPSNLKMLRDNSDRRRETGQDADATNENGANADQRQAEENGEEINLEQDEVNMGAEEFLLTVLGVPESWIHEAKAVAARVSGKRMTECEEWLRCKHEQGAIRCHEVLLTYVIPDAIVANDKTCLSRVCEMLIIIENNMSSMSSNIPDWTCGGGLILGYLRHIAGIPQLVDTDIDTLHRLAANTRVFVDRATVRKADTAKCAGCIMADGIITAQRALLMRVPDTVAEKWLMSILSDLEEVPCSKAVRLRLTAEYTLIATYGWPGAQRIAGAFPAYRKYLEALGDHIVDDEPQTDEIEAIVVDAVPEGGEEGQPINVRREGDVMQQATPPAELKVMAQ